LSLSVALLAIACGGGEPAPSVGSALIGTIEVDGSSTVFPITEAVAEEFNKEHRNVQVNVGVSGTGGGFKRFIVGETDINDASRPINASEVAQAAANGVEFIEFQIAYDGLSVVVNLANDFVTCLTVEELQGIWEPGSTVNTWNGVRASFPNSALRLYGPDPDSGTFDYFTEVIVGEAQASRSEYTASADDHVLVRGVSGDRLALGYFGYAYYIENEDKVKVVAVDAGNGCVLPSNETVASGEYSPLSRPLYIYVNSKSLEKPEVKAFVQFYMREAAGLVREVGYVALNPDEYEGNLSNIQ